MPAPRVSDDEFIELCEKLGMRGTAKKLGGADKNVTQRRQRLERRLGRTIAYPATPWDHARVILPPQLAWRAELSVPEGIVLVASDAHYWPGETTTMHRALVAFAREYKPRAIIMNGDVLDLPRASRHAPIGWENRPAISEEIEWGQERLHEVEKAAGRAEKIWTAGNHDLRFETRIANLAPEYAKVHRVHLHDHFPLWRTAWSAWINDDVVVKHRFRGGIHAVYNNVLHSGKHSVTGHRHSAEVRGFTDYNGTRWGVDGGCLAEPNARAFVDYTEDNVKNWRSAFVLLTFRAGRVMLPELVLKWDNEHVQFRGEIIAV